MKSFVRFIAFAVSSIALCALPCLSAEPEEKDFTPEFVQQCKAKAEAGDAEGMALYGWALSNGWGVDKDEFAAIPWLQMAADAGNPIGQRFLGMCYHLGRGVEKDEAKAVEWYRKAAEAGLSQAMFILALHYEDGTGVEKDQAKAMEWFRKAADAGDTLAMCRIGRRYRFGEGVEKDMVQAVEWFRKAAKAGNFFAKKQLADLGYDDEERKDVESILAASKAMEGKTMVVDGFYLGMNLSDAEALYKSKYPGKTIGRTPLTSNSELQRGIRLEIAPHTKPGLWEMDADFSFCQADSQKKVRLIRLDKNKVRQVFQLNAMDYDDWAERFSKKFNYPMRKKTVEAHGQNYCWVYQADTYIFDVPFSGCKVTYFGKISLDIDNAVYGDDVFSSIKNDMYKIGLVYSVFDHNPFGTSGTLVIEAFEGL